MYVELICIPYQPVYKGDCVMLRYLHGPPSTGIVPSQNGLCDLRPIIPAPGFGIPPSQMPDVTLDAIAARAIATLGSSCAYMVDKVLTFKSVSGARCKPSSDEEKKERGKCGKSVNRERSGG